MERTKYDAKKRANKHVAFNYLCKRKKVDDRSDNCEIREITEFFEQTQINILRQFGHSIDMCFLTVRAFHILSLDARECNGIFGLLW